MNAAEDDLRNLAAPVPRDRFAEERFEAEAVTHLNDLFRTALRMTAERRQAEEVAGILSIPIGTLMSRLSRGRGLLRAAAGGGSALVWIGSDVRKVIRL